MRLQRSPEDRRSCRRLLAHAHGLLAHAHDLLVRVAMAVLLGVHELLVRVAMVALLGMVVSRRGDLRRTRTRRRG